MSPGVWYYGNLGDADERMQYWLDNPPSSICIDVETIDLKERMPLGIGISPSPLECFYCELYPEPNLKFLEAIRPMLSTAQNVKVGSNMLFDLGVLPLIPIIGNTIDRFNLFDINVAARLKGYEFTALDTLAPTVLGKSHESMQQVWHKYGAKDNMELITKAGHSVLAAKCAEDCMLEHEIYHKWNKEIRDTYGQYFLVEMAVIPLLVDMALKGIALDTEAVDGLIISYSREVAGLYQKIQAYGIENPGSPSQVGYILGKRGNFLKFTRSKKQYSTRNEDLEFCEDELAKLVLQYRHSNTFLTRYLLPIQGKDRFYTEYYMDTGVGRLNSRNMNIQNIPAANEKLGDPGARFIMMPDSGLWISGDYCLAPDTKILNSKLNWIKLSDCKVGDNIIGVDEDNIGVTRKLRYTNILSKRNVRLPSYRIKMSSGKDVVASGQHPWLVRRTINLHGKKITRDCVWRYTSNLKVGDEIRSVPTWEKDNSYASGYVAGALDGEGHVYSWNYLIFTQNENGMLYKFTDMLDSLAITYKVDSHSNHKAYSIRIRGTANVMRTIGMTRPARILDNYSIDGAEIPSMLDTITSIESIGEQDLISIETSTHTYIAEGLVTHNSQEHLYIIANRSKDPDMLKVYYDPQYEGNRDIHQYVASELNIPRKIAKTINYALAYGATPKTLSEQAKIKDLRQCSSLLDKWFSRFRTAGNWIKAIQAEGMKTGWAVETLFGRRIKLPEEGEDGMKRKAVNYPVLGSDGEVMKRALLLSARRGLRPPVLAITVHDSVSWDTKDSKKVMSIKDELENIPGFRIPFEIKETFRWE